VTPGTVFPKDAINVSFFPHKGDGKCPAKGKTCSVCGIMNHFAKVCKKGNGQDQSNQSGGATQSKSSNYVSKKIYHVAENKEDKKIDSEEYEMFKKCLII
jgi:hypothetical protein